MRTLELLAPARTADIGIEAIRHGADAVYIGAPKYGARAAAGNSVEDIGRLAGYAHQFDARIYVTINTILYDDELPQVEQLVQQLLAVGVDAFIVQDFALVEILRRSLSFLEKGGEGLLHASTQMDNRTAEKVRWLAELGFAQVVLARELSLEEIRSIHTECPDVKLEVFVHGALCVSLSGQCYASEALLGRSANRGECAQVCRMEFDLEDEKGVKYQHNKHLLSLKDLCQLDALEDLANAGVSSFKIEGRLKDMAYVKNVTAAYSEALNALCAKHPQQYRRASRGQTELKFKPDVRKSFNRGFTHYFLYGRNDGIFSFDTPKAVGVPLTHCVAIEGQAVVVEPGVAIANGDGLCFFNRSKRLIGFRVNRVAGQRVYPFIMPHDLMPGMRLYRNYDKRFADVLEGTSAERFIPVDVIIDYDGNDFMLTMSDGVHVAGIRNTCEAELARTHQTENVQRQLAKLGNTVLRARSVKLQYQKNYFIPSSLLAKWRRELTEAFLSAMAGKQRNAQSPSRHLPSSGRAGILPCDYKANVANRQAAQFYAANGVEVVEPAFEQQHRKQVPVMFCRHCLRYAMGWCQRRQADASPPPAQLFLRLENGTRFPLQFECQQCQMLVLTE